MLQLLESIFDVVLSEGEKSYWKSDDFYSPVVRFQIDGGQLHEIRLIYGRFGFREFAEAGVREGSSPGSNLSSLDCHG